MKNITRLIIVCLGSLGLATAITACSKKEPVRLGFVGALTGRGADLGIAGRNGAMLAIEQRNAAGGINGHQIELLPRDDGQNADTAKRVVAELIEQQVTAIIGPMTSNVAMATVPLVDASRTIMISPTVTTNDLSGKDDNFFRVVSANSEYATNNARFQIKKLGHRRAAAIYDLSNKAFTENWLNDFRARYETLGGRMVLAKPFVSGNEPAFHEMVKDLLAAKPDVIVIIANAVDAALICQQVRKLDQRVAFTMVGWAATERLLELGGSAVEGAHVDQYFNRDDTSTQFTTFIQGYRKRFSMEPGFAAITAYDAANVLLDALARKGPKQTLREAIQAAPTYEGLQQRIVFDRNGDSHRNTYISTVRNGKFVIVEQ